MGGSDRRSTVRDSIIQRGEISVESVLSTTDSSNDKRRASAFSTGSNWGYTPTISARRMSASSVTSGTGHVPHTFDEGTAIRHGCEISDEVRQTWSNFRRTVARVLEHGWF